MIRHVAGVFAALAVGGLIGAICYRGSHAGLLMSPTGVVGGGGGGTITWNPSDAGTYTTLSNFNLTAGVSGISSWSGVRSTSPQTSGKCYSEFHIDELSDLASYTMIGVANSSANLLSYLGSDANSYGLTSTSNFTHNAAYTSGYVYATFVAGNWIGIARDLTNSKIWVQDVTAASGWNAGTSGTQDPGSNAGGFVISDITGGASVYWIFAGQYTTTPPIVTANFGHTSFFLSSLPSGFTACGA